MNDESGEDEDALHSHQLRRLLNADIRQVLCPDSCVDLYSERTSNTTHARSSLVQ